MRTHQMLQIDGWRAEGHHFPWVHSLLMKMVLALITATCMPHSAKLNPYLNIYTGGLTIFLLLWHWSSAQPFPIILKTGFTRIGAAVLCCSHPVCRPWCLWEGSTQMNGGSIYSFLFALKRLTGARLEDTCVVEWARTIWLNHWKQCLNSLLLFAVICTPISQCGSTSHMSRVVKITAQGTGESQTVAL